MTEIVGTFAMLASMTITFLGLPTQVRRNHKNKRCGLGAELVWAAVCSYNLWALYGWLKPDWFLAAAQTVGATFAWILLFQFFLYRKNQVIRRKAK